MGWEEGVGGMGGGSRWDGRRDWVGWEEGLGGVGGGSRLGGRRGKDKLTVLLLELAKLWSVLLVFVRSSSFGNLNGHFIKHVLLDN